MFTFTKHGSWLVATAPAGSRQADYIEAKRLEHPNREHAVRCKPGDERFVIRDFQRWCKTGARPATPATDPAALATAMMSAPPAPAKPSRADRLTAVYAKAFEAAREWMDADNGVRDASTRGRIIAAANELHQLRFGVSLEFAKTQRELKAFEAYEFITGVAL